MSFLKKLFGGGDTSAAAPCAPAAEEHYRDVLIQATPIEDAGQYRLAGTISKGSGEARREHRFVRADLFQTADEAAHTALHKGRQLVDEQSDALFRD